MPDDPTHALVVTGRAGRSDLTEALLRSLRDTCHLTGQTTRWLAEGEAAELALTLPSHPDALLQAARKAASGFDVNLVSLADRRKRLLIADMDSTMIEQECIDEMAAEFGLKDQIAIITERAMRGELDFEAALKERLGLLQGLDEAALERVFRDRITLMAGARTLIATMKHHGAYTALVSGGFTFFTSRVARALGFDTNRANILAFENGRLAGGVVGPVLGKEAKRAALIEFAAMRGLPMSATLAVGDGANDLDMIRSASLGVAYRAKPIVAAEAAASITAGDLTALLYLQGYTRTEFVTP